MRNNAKVAEHLDSEAECVTRVRQRLGDDLRLALPLGLGKPVGLVDAFYREACDDPTLTLQILTALTLERPVESDPVRGRLLSPVFDRVFAHYSEPLYASAVRQQRLPNNVSVSEFYFKAGSRTGNAAAQQDYISSNYTHAARDVAARGANVVMQLLARHPDGRLSASCNPDMSAELLARLRDEGRDFITIGVVHPDLPFMFDDAELDIGELDYLLDTDSRQHGLFAMPRLQPIPAADYSIGLLASSLVKDGGTLQLGIGSMGDAIVQSLLMRDQRNSEYRQMLANWPLDIAEAASIGGLSPFEQGLYGATEMFVEGFLHLYEAGILRRRVYDFWALQALVNSGRCDPDKLDAGLFAALADEGVRELRGKDFAVLQYHGLFRDDCHYHEGQIQAASGECCPANLANPDTQAFLAAHCLGEGLRHGKVLHGGFFLGSDDFYQRLREMPEERRRELAMCGVNKINQLDLNPRLYRLQRRDARFINTGLNVSLNGAVASDTLESGQVISGVGGQYNFVAMAHQLQTGRSILMIRASRQQSGEAVSNILSQYGSCTVPRHLRDMVITEYGIADLRSKRDAEVAAALIGIADSRFQPALIREAQQRGKLPADFSLPEARRQNTPEKIQHRIAEGERSGLCPRFPLGCDFSDLELEAGALLIRLSRMTWREKVQLLWRGSSASGRQQEILQRLALDSPENLHEKILRRLICGLPS
ncbi:acetyl-CoA hydrolase/transferase C-terminal domain-containing protein [Spongiibacter tropicus]|uniref:acetyl-CoA hydrolase/transferase C-terminal domain-containing protein n=1 Tax=Spongiibacter tropicus TaxID=454602 RepID=UPI003A99F30A